MLDELAVLTGLHRKSVVRLLKGPSLERQPRRRQRGREYGAAVDDALRVIWESLDYVCAERLTPALVSTAEQLARHGELAVTRRAAGAVGPDQRVERPAAADPAGPGHDAAAAAWPRAGEQGGAGDPDAADSVGHDRAWALRGRSGPPQRPAQQTASSCTPSR